MAKCEICSEPYDEDDLKEAEETGVCPFCGYHFVMVGDPRMKRKKR